MTELVKRTLSGVVYVGVVVGCILYDEAAFIALSAVLSLLAVREFNRLTHPRCRTDLLGESAAVILNLAIGSHLYAGLPVLNVFTLIYVVLVLAVLLAELWDKSGNPIANWGYALIGQVMIALPFALMNIINHLSPYLLLAVFVLIWTNDTGAYCVGSLTAKLPKGNHKMFPRVSPKKSWEGLFGGIMLAVGAGLLLAYFGWFDRLSDGMNHYLVGVCFALLVAVFGTLGDLMESLLKRTIGVKDSGRFLPGHGGVLDRFDSILLAVPVIALFLIIVLYL